MTVILVIASGICATGWFFCSVAAEALGVWIKRKGLHPEEEEVRSIVREVIKYRFRVT